MSRELEDKSDAFAAIQSSATGMLRAGTIDKAAMRRFDASCLTAPPPIASSPARRPRRDAFLIEVEMKSRDLPRER